jgi:DNA (cytosine-5)-methyltransferase 1
MEEFILKPKKTDKTLKILNLFCGIGGNRLKWTNCEVTAIDLDSEICDLYQKRFINDKVICGDAFQFFEDHWEEYDVIWASPPCQTHSRQQYRQKEKVLPDFRLYSLIKFCQLWVKDKIWVIENVEVIDEVIPHTFKVNRHLFWSNLVIPSKTFEKLYNPPNYIGKDGKKHNGGLSDLSIAELLELHQMEDFNHKEKRSILRNCVDYRIGEYILNYIQSK